MGIFRKFFKKRIKGFSKIKKFFKDKSGLEIGGPSHIFKRERYIPVYPLAKRIDGVNFSTNTVWENIITEGFTYKYDDKFSPGYQYIKEGSELDSIPDGSLDFVLASHSLEHIANPLKALKEWIRILKKDGVILSILPDKRYTFDHKRPITTFAHLLDDYENNIGEDDLTHLDEILLLHDRILDTGLINKDEFPVRSLNNANNRCLHHHVFDIDLLKEMFAYLGLEVILTGYARPCHQIIVGKKKD